ncbi:MAG TPA: HDOD domain-containing protein, partial [Bryobacteraceae bacterium]|nr:HDOD domain-containing protein [Bryobacteraceae bacterium]
ITTVPMAVSRLGMDRVKATATMIALNAMVKGALRFESLRKFWTHSLVTAFLTEECARISHSSIDCAYTAGLLHNLGSLGLMAAYPDEYARMLMVSIDYHYDLLQTERDLFEIDHCAAGAYLAQEWNFPDEIAAAIATHHDEPEPGDRSIYGLVQIGWRLADALGYVAFPPEREWTYDELVARIPGSDRSWIGTGIEAAREEVNLRLSSIPL